LTVQKQYQQTHTIILLMYNFVCLFFSYQICGEIKFYIIGLIDLLCTLVISAAN